MFLIGPRPLPGVPTTEGVDSNGHRRRLRREIGIGALRRQVPTRNRARTASIFVGDYAAGRCRPSRPDRAALLPASRKVDGRQTLAIKPIYQRTVELAERLDLPSLKMCSSPNPYLPRPAHPTAQAPSARTTSSFQPRLRGSLSCKICPAFIITSPCRRARSASATLNGLASYFGLTPVSWRVADLGSGYLVRRRFALLLAPFLRSPPAEPFLHPSPHEGAAVARSRGQGRPHSGAARRACP